MGEERLTIRGDLSFAIKMTVGHINGHHVGGFCRVGGSECISLSWTLHGEKFFLCFLQAQ